MSRLICVVPSERSNVYGFSIGNRINPFMSSISKNGQLTSSVDPEDNVVTHQDLHYLLPLD